ATPARFDAGSGPWPGESLPLPWPVVVRGARPRPQPTPSPAAKPLVETDLESGSIAAVLGLPIGGRNHTQAAEIGRSLRSTATVLALQRAIGNHAVQHVLGARTASSAVVQR